MVAAHLADAGASAASPDADCGSLLWSFFQRYGRTFDYEAHAVRVSSGGFGPKLAAWVRGDRAAALAVEDPQEAGKDIGSGSFNIDAVRSLFSRAADALASGRARGGGGAPTWAAVQAGGASRSVPEARGGLLDAIMDVDAALGRRRAAAAAAAGHRRAAARPVERRPPASGDRGRGAARPPAGHPHHPRPPLAAAKAPPGRRVGKFAARKAGKAAAAAGPTSVHRPMGAPHRGGGGGGKSAPTRRGARAGGKRKVEWG